MLVVLGLSLLTARHATRGEALDPDNPAPSGAQAVARVLSRHGVDVTVVRSAARLAGTSVNPETTVMVTSAQNLGRATAAQLQRRSAGIVVAPRRTGAVLLWIAAALLAWWSASEDF